jgi:hypothetical protein
MKINNRVSESVVHIVRRGPAGRLALVKLARPAGPPNVRRSGLGDESRRRQSGARSVGPNLKAKSRSLGGRGAELGPRRPTWPQACQAHWGPLFKRQPQICLFVPRRRRRRRSTETPNRRRPEFVAPFWLEPLNFLSRWPGVLSRAHTNQTALGRPPCVPLVMNSTGARILRS